MTATMRFGSASRGALVACAALVLLRPAVGASPASDGPASRPFAAPQTLVPGRAVLFDEADDPALRAALAAELQQLFQDLYGRQGWRPPFAGAEPLRIYVGRRESAGAREPAGAPDRSGLGAAALHVDGMGLATSEIVHQVGLQVALATLAGYGPTADAFTAAAAAEVMIGGSSGGARAEGAWALAAAPLVDFRAQPATLGPLWIDEAVRATGDNSLLRSAWERASATGETVRDAIAQSIFEAAGITPDTLLARCAARLYASMEPDASPSRLRLMDLQTGGLDAAPPAELEVRHRTYLPDSSDEALRVRWPDDGGAGAAVVRYRDSALPADVVFFRAGDLRAIPLSGVERIDFLVAGSATGGRGFQAPALCETAAATFRGLDAHASAGPEGPRLSWSTTGHDGLWGWAIFREEVLADGRIARTGPEIVPSSERAEESFRYLFVDSGASAGTFYRYTVWAVTDEGLLARAFSATLKAGAVERGGIAAP